MTSYFKKLQLNEYLKEHFIADKRIDGRKFFEHRQFLINWNSITTADGSAIVKLGETTIVCGITIDLENNKDENETGKNSIETSVQIQPYFSSNTKTENNFNDEALILSEQIKKIISNGLKLELLNLDNSHFFKMLIEVIVINNYGNCLGACSIAILAALLNIKNYKFELKSFPIATTFCIATIEAKNVKLLTDPNLEEESFSTSTLMVCVDADTENIILINKFGADEMDRDCIRKCINETINHSKKIKNLLLNKNDK